MRTQNVKAKVPETALEVSGIAQESGHDCTNATKTPRTSSSSSVRSVVPSISLSTSSHQQLYEQSEKFISVASCFIKG